MSGYPEQQQRPLPLPRSISTTNLETTRQCRALIQQDWVSRDSAGGTNFFQNMPCFTFSLPSLSEYSPEFRQPVFDCLIDKERQRFLEAEHALNWCHSATTLYPLFTMGGGNNLLHAASLGMWGFQDRDYVLRRAVHQALINHSGNTLYKRWLYKHQGQDWLRIVHTASPDALPAESLEEFHVFVLANVLRRPIIVYTITRPSRVVFDLMKHICNVQFCGIYLPLLWDSNSCKKDPLPLAYYAGHFSALAVADSSFTYQHTPHINLPLCDYDGLKLPVRYALPANDLLVEADPISLISDYLNINYTSTTSDLSGLIPLPIICAKMSLHEQPKYLKSLLSGFIEACWAALAGSPPFKHNEKAKVLSSEGEHSHFASAGTQISEEDKHLLAVEQAIERKGTLFHSLAHGCFAGPAGSGKSSLMTRLLGHMPSSTSPSTGVADGVVHVEVRKSSSIAVSATQSESSFTWLKILYDDEASLLANRIFSTPPNVFRKDPSSFTLVKQTSTSSNAQQNLSSPSSDGVLPPSESGAKASLTQDREFEDSMAHSNETSSKNTMSASTQPSGYIPPKKVFKGALDRRNLIKLQEKFKKSWSLYLTDTGGQIEFQELLPLVVSGPSIFFITFCLNQDLNQRFTIEYRLPNGEKSKPYQSTLTVKEMILQTLASIASMGAFKYQEKESVQLKPKVLIVGTHRDLLNKDTVQFDVKKIDEDLQKTIKSTSHYENLVCFSSEFQMIYAVNNFSEDDTEFEEIRSDVDRIVRHGHFKVEFPSHWLIFSLVLRQEMIQDRIISYDQCFTIAEDCGIADHEELNHALWFLHTKVGLVRHFATPSLRDMVIRDPQIMFDQVTRLIVNTFTFKKVGKYQSDEFKKKGIFDLEDFEEESGNPSLLTSEKLVELLKHLRIVAPFQMHSRTKYFIPCVLAHSDVSGFSPSTKNSDIPPLLVTFSCGYCPKGLSGALITFLLTNEMKSEFPWKLQTDQIFRDQVLFLVSPYDTITLKIHPTFLEISHFRPSIPTHCKPISVSSVCHAVCQSVQEGIRTVSRDIGLTSKAEHSLNSYCQNLSCIEKNGPHPATEPITGGSGDEPCSLLCKMSSTISIPPPKYLVWFGKDIKTENSHMISKSRLGDQDVPNLMLVLARYASKWKELGTALQFTTDELDLINSMPLLISSGPQSFLQKLLSQWIQRPSDQSRGSPATLEALERALQSDLVRLGTVAEELRERLEKSAP